MVLAPTDAPMCVCVFSQLSKANDFRLINRYQSAHLMQANSLRCLLTPFTLLLDKVIQERFKQKGIVCVCPPYKMIGQSIVTSGKDLMAMPSRNHSQYNYRCRALTTLLIMQMQLLHLNMPIGHNFTCAIAVNNPYQGLLHMLIRHCAEFEQHVPGLRSQRLSLPLIMQQKMLAISADVNIHAAAPDVKAFMKMTTRSAEKTLYCAQMMLFRFLQSTVNRLYAGSSCNLKGQSRLLYTVKGASAPLKLAPSSTLDPANPAFGTRKPVRNIITAFF